MKPVIRNWSEVLGDFFDILPKPVRVDLKGSASPDTWVSPEITLAFLQVVKAIRKTEYKTAESILTSMNQEEASVKQSIGLFRAHLTTLEDSHERADQRSSDGVLANHSKNCATDVIIDLTLCGKGNGVTAHGGGDYGYELASLMVQWLPECNIEIFALKGDIEAAKISMEGSRASITWTKNPVITDLYELDNENTLMVLPLPYRYMNEAFLRTKCRKLFVIHGVRQLELMRGARIYLSSLGIDSKGIDKAIKNEMQKFSIFEEYLKSTDILLAPSRTTQRHLNNIFKNNNARVEILYPPNVFKNKIVREKYFLNNDFKILFLSADRAEKNFHTFLSSLDYFEKDFPLKITIIGVPVTYRRQANNDSIEIKYLEYQDNDKLVSLFEESDLLVYPSVSEGFGIPPVEFLKRGKFVLVGYKEIFKETLGEAANYCDPTCPISISSEIASIYHRKENIEKSNTSGFVQFELLEKNFEYQISQIQQKVLSSCVSSQGLKDVAD